jgi:branched-chain amino acid aminotransferase
MQQREGTAPNSVTASPPTASPAASRRGAASLQIWLDGQLVDKADAKVSVYDHGLLYGDGVFEGIRVYSGKIFECDAHVRRLYDSAKAIRLEIPYTKDQFCAAMYDTIRANNFTDCYIRAVVTRGAGDLGIDPKKSPRPSVIIIADQVSVYPKELYEKGIAVITSSWTRNHPNSTPPRVKSLNYLNNVLAKIEANDAGVPEAIVLNHMGNVAEATADNVFVVRDGLVKTPPSTEGALEGITRGAILRLCKQLNIPCVESVLQRQDLFTADEMFLTGTGAEVIAVTKVDGRVVGTGVAGPITKRLLEAFHKHVREA